MTEIESLIEAHAVLWGYSDDDRAHLVEKAQLDPVGIQTAYETDMRFRGSEQEIQHLFRLDKEQRRAYFQRLESRLHSTYQLKEAFKSAWAARPSQRAVMMDG